MAGYSQSHPKNNSAMVKLEDIYRATGDGLDIIKYYYPDCTDTDGSLKKHFKMRNEKTPSASIKKYGDVYKVTDFGDQATAISPIDIVMREEGVKFAEAVAILADRYSVVSDRIDGNINKPDIRTREALPDEPEGRTFELADGFTEAQLRVMGPKVTTEIMQSLHWFAAKSITYIKDRKVTVKYATDTYPIFMRQCTFQDKGGETKSFYKIYEPLNVDKRWRFSYTPDGVKPKEFINGLSELAAAYTKYNEQERQAWESDPVNENKPYREKKLDEAFICSGERDALCCRALGYHPLWFNSETYQVQPHEIKLIGKYVERIYNIPDIDETGVRRGTELALQYLDIYTVWLPQKLRSYRDNRGRPRKDLRDFCEIYPAAEDFKNLLKLAYPARFWEESWSDRVKRMTYEIDSTCLHYFLGLSGFHTLHDDNSDQPRFIHIDGCKVTPVKGRDIHSYLRTFSASRFLDKGIRNLLLNSPRLGESSLAYLDEVDLDFTDCTPDSQLLFFDNETWCVTKQGISVSKGLTTDNKFVWADKVVPHRVKVLDPLFKAEYRPDTGDYDLQVLSAESPFFDYIINTSRMYWRRELEQNLADMESEEREQYRREHKFDIDGPNLTEDERLEQKQNLLSKIFAIGYVMHAYKVKSRAWALYAMDGKVDEEDKCNGRSGKSIFMESFRLFKNSVKISGRDPKVMENPHVFERVTRDTDYVFVDDCAKYMSTDRFYDIITSGMVVNPKNSRSYELRFEESPKISFSTNYVPKDLDQASTRGRMIYLVFSDYYHEMGPDYTESRSVHDDFGFDLFGDTYTEQMWNADINFFAQCLQFYLGAVEHGKVQPNMQNIIQRKYKADMGSAFEDWAYMYFDRELGHVDTLIQRDMAYDDFLASAKTSKAFWTMQRFTKALSSFCEMCPYVIKLNPESMQNNSGRILRRNEQGETKEWIYVQTKPETPIVNEDGTVTEKLPF